MEEKKLGKLDVFLMLITGLMFADAIASDSSAGVPAMAWWLILGVLYMIPSGMIIGELSGVLPGEGGIYVWIKEGIGPRAAAMCSWLFFCCGLFIPVSSFIMCSDILFTLFLPTAPYIIRVVVAIVIIWIMVFVCSKSMDEAKWVTNLSGWIKLSFFVLSFVAGIVFIAQGNALANSMTLKDILPTADQGLMYLPIIVYCCTGMELASASAEQTKNPKKTLPKVIVGVAILAVFLNIISTFGMLAVVPVDEIDLDFGLLALLDTVFHSPVLYYLFGIALLFSVFAQCVTWMVGANRGTCESGKAGELPAIFGKENKDGQPIGAIIISAVAGTVFLILYAFLADSASDLFFSLLNCGVIGSLLPYVFMIIAYQRLKKAGRMDNYDGFKCPAGIACSWVVQIIQCATLLLMIYIPGYGIADDILTSLISAVVMIGAGIIAIRYAENHKAPISDNENE